MPGPLPKRSDKLIRRNIPEVPVDKITVIGSVPIPELDIDQPHPLVVDIYESLKSSAQNVFYEASDWQTARLAMYALNEELHATWKEGGPKPMSAVKLQVINQMMASLMMTEGERRRARLEIERTQNPSGEDGQILTMADHFKQRLGAT